MPRPSTARRSKASQRRRSPQDEPKTSRSARRQAEPEAPPSAKRDGSQRRAAASERRPASPAQRQPSERRRAEAAEPRPAKRGGSERRGAETKRSQSERRSAEAKRASAPDQRAKAKQRSGSERQPAEPKRASSERRAAEAKRSSGERRNGKRSSGERRRDTDDQRPTRRTQQMQARRGKSMALPILITVGALVLLGVLAMTMSTNNAPPPATPEQQARNDFDEAANLVHLAIESRQFDDATSKLTDLGQQLSDPLLASASDELSARIATLENELAAARLDLRVADVSLVLWKHLRDLTCEPDLDGLEQRIAAFVADPVAAVDGEAVPGYDPSEHRQRFDNAPQLFKQERAARAAGLVEPSWPTSSKDGLDMRMARRQLQNAESSVPKLLANKQFSSAFRMLQENQKKYPDVSFKGLWEKTVAALEQDWPGIKTQAEQLTRQALASNDAEQRAEARGQLRKLIPSLGDERYMAELRPLLTQLGDD